MSFFGMHLQWKYRLIVMRVYSVWVAVDARSWFSMKERVETRSENARHVILKYENKLYHINKVTVEPSKGQKTYNATFSAKRLKDNQPTNLGLEIPKNMYDILMEYTKLGNSDILLVLHVEDDDFKWGLVSESWLRQQTSSKVNRYVI